MMSKTLSLAILLDILIIGLLNALGQDVSILLAGIIGICTVPLARAVVND